MLSLSLIALVFGACSTSPNIPIEPTPIPAPPEKPQAGQITGMDNYLSALEDTSYKQDKIPSPQQVIDDTEEHAAYQKEHDKQWVKPTPAIEDLPPTVTGLSDTELAKEAGYPISPISKE